MKNKLIVIAGPTAIGKTTKAIQLAQWLDSEIISADSRQFYKELKIGVAAPSTEEMDTVKHNFVGHLSIADNYNVSKYEQGVLQFLGDYFKKALNNLYAMSSCPESFRDQHLYVRIHAKLEILN